MGSMSWPFEARMAEVGSHVWRHYETQGVRIEAMEIMDCGHALGVMFADHRRAFRTNCRTPEEVIADLDRQRANV